MEKKNTLLLTVIAVATLLVAVVGATFAYFAGSTTTNASVNVNAVVANGSDSVFVATSDGDISINVTAADMAVEVNNNTTPKRTDSANVLVKYSSTATVKCTYDLVYTQDSTSDQYVITSGVTDETEFILVIEKYSANVANGTAVSSWGTVVSTDTQNFPSITKGATGASAQFSIVDDDDITSTADGNDHWNKYVITAKFFNLDYDQGDQKGKSYKGTVSVSTPSCVAVSS